ncbi:hypothetical protein QQZ08_001824 [Neonectria magnoliae]|uniref:Protein kinase domain-containing protein n=1 Tax=Neonectria magnoliae TaxID=2732573 RepID=A0ABR1IDG1_9HYPO
MSAQKPPCDSGAGFDQTYIVEPDKTSTNTGGDAVAENAVVSGKADPEPKFKFKAENEVRSWRRKANGSVGSDGSSSCEWRHESYLRHRVIIFQKGKEYFHATTKDRATVAKDLDLGSLNLVRIPSEDVYPKFKQGLTESSESLPNTYIREPYLTSWTQKEQGQALIADLLLEQAEVYEILKNHPHPNIREYYGCVVEDDRIIGLRLAKSGRPLRKKLADASLAERKMYYEGIENGIRHLHQLGLVHNDLKPWKILVKGNTPIIAGFGRCKRVGEDMGRVYEASPWIVDGLKIASKETDLRSLRALEKYILNGGDVQDEAAKLD